MLQDAPKHTFFTKLRSSGQPKNSAKTLFFYTLHSLSLVIFATATVAAFVLLRNSRFNFHCYTQREATPTQKSAWKWCCDPSRLLAWKITKGIHSCKPASLNCPVGKQLGHQSWFFWAESCTERVQNAKWYAMGTWWSLSMGLAEVCKSKICCLGDIFCSCAGLEA